MLYGKKPALNFWLSGQAGPRFQAGDRGREMEFVGGGHVLRGSHVF